MWENAKVHTFFANWNARCIYPFTSFRYISIDIWYADIWSWKLHIYTTIKCAPIMLSTKKKRFSLFQSKLKCVQPWSMLNHQLIHEPIAQHSAITCPRKKNNIIEQWLDIQFNLFKDRSDWEKIQPMEKTLDAIEKTEFWSSWHWLFSYSLLKWACLIL